MPMELDLRQGADLRGSDSVAMAGPRVGARCPVTDKSARRVAADLRGPDWMARVRRPIVMENGPRAARTGIVANESGPIGAAKSAPGTALTST